VALCAVLLVGSGLFVRSLRSALAIDPGFRTEDLGVLRFDLGTLRYTNAEIHEFAAELRARALADPRVSAAATATLVPFQGGGFLGFMTEVRGYRPAADEEMRIDVVAVSPGYVETLGIPLLAGREFEDADDEGSTPVAIVNRSMAERYWPRGEAVGGFLRLREEWAEVVGVAEDVRWSALRGETTNFVFLPHAQFAEIVSGPLTLAVRTRGSAIEALSGVGAQARSMEPDFSPALSTTMEDLVGDVLMPQRLGSTLLSAFSALALLLASIGIAGVVSYGVREQRRAIGLRLALGARRSQVLRMVAMGMALPVAGGLALGLALASLMDDGVERFLYGVTPGDPLTYVLIVVGLSAVAALAVLIPAREATRVDPLEALRSD
jgi:putative ABC transport system permease protein